MSDGFRIGFDFALGVISATGTCFILGHLVMWACETIGRLLGRGIARIINRLP